MSPAYIRLIPTHQDADSRFYSWFFFAVYCNNVFNGMGGGVRQNLTPRDLLEFPLPLPDLATQRQIADFLDRETARIDLLIDKKQRLVALLGEQESTAIYSLLSARSLDQLETRYSRLPWKFEIPADWQEKTLKQTAQVIDCKHTTPTYVDTGYPLISTGETKPYSISFVSNRQVSEDDYRSMTEGGRKPQDGDIIYSRNASVGSAAMVRDLEPFCMGQDICLIQPYSIDPRFLEHQLNSKILHLQLEPLLVGSTLKRINVNQIKNFSLVIPPRETQTMIAKAVDVLRDRSRKTNRATLESVDRLKEFRSALITAAVMGRINVQTYAKASTVDRRLDAIQEETQA